MGEPLILQLFIASSIPVVKILCICGIGAFCARKGLLTPEGRRVLGALSFLVFNPALIFVKLASTLTPGRLLHWWPLVLNTGISTTVGLGLGYLGVRLTQPPHVLRPHTIVSIALGNLGNLPLVIVSTLATSSATILNGIPADRAEALAVSYVVVGLLLPVIAHATIGFSMLRKPNTAVLPEPKDPRPGGLDEDDDEAVAAMVATPHTAALAAVAAAAAAKSGKGEAAAVGPAGRVVAAAATAAAVADGPPESPCLKTLDSLVLRRHQQRQPLLARQLELSCSSSNGDSGYGCGVGEASPSQPLLLAVPPAPSLCPPSASTSSLPTATASAAPSSQTSSSSGLAESACGFAASSDADAYGAGVAAGRTRPRPAGEGGIISGGGGAGNLYDDDYVPLLRALRCPSGGDLGAVGVRPVGLRAGAVRCDADCPDRTALMTADGALSGPHVRFAGDTEDEVAPRGVALPPLGAAAASPSGCGPGRPPHAAVELPALEGARLMPARRGSFSRLLRSASGHRTLGHLVRSSSGRHVLLEWSSRVDWRAVARHVVHEATSPPLLAILLSIPVGCIRPLQEAFFGSGEPGAGAGRGEAPLSLVTGCLEMLGDCTIPSILLILGATLANGPGAARVPLRVISLVTATRLALLPLLGLGLVMGAYMARMFEAPDPIYLLVLLIQNTAPTAIMVHTMASVQGNRSEEVSTILFWGYIMGIVAIPLWLTLFLYIVKQEYRNLE